MEVSRVHPSGWKRVHDINDIVWYSLTSYENMSSSLENGIGLTTLCEHKWVGNPILNSEKNGMLVAGKKNKYVRKYVIDFDFTSLN